MSCSESTTLLGDRVQQALERIGITDDSVSRWLGTPCGCDERRAKLNALDAWARRIIGGKLAKAKEYLRAMIGADE